MSTFPSHRMTARSLTWKKSWSAYNRYVQACPFSASEPGTRVLDDPSFHKLPQTGWQQQHTHMYHKYILKPDIRKWVLSVRPHLYSFRLIKRSAIGIFESPKCDVNPQPNTRGIGPLVGRTSGYCRSVMHVLVKNFSITYNFSFICQYIFI